MLERPSRCDTCDRRCERSTSPAIALCSFGVHYCRLNPDTTIMGFLTQEPVGTSAYRKNLTKYKDNFINRHQIEKLIKHHRDLQSKVYSEVQEEKDKLIEKYLEEHKYKADLLEVFGPVLREKLSILHDYRQFVARVRQNINVVLATRYPEQETMDEKLDAALAPERAIYFSSILMGEKLDVVFMLLNPSCLRPRDIIQFRVHGLMTKYLKIYQSAFEEKGIRVRTEGTSFGMMSSDASIVGVIFQTLLDNALKYSPPQGEVCIRYEETDAFITISISGHGPEIGADEIDKIFQLFYRGRGAASEASEGVGVGLYLAQCVANELGTRIEVFQGGPTKGRLKWTTFSIRFRRSG